MNYPLTLEQYIAQMPMQEAELARMGAQIAEALSVIHQQGRVHGDVKPGNILVVSPGNYQLIGYENVRQYPEGTIPTFVAPELTQGGAYHAGTDVYALGMLMKSLIPKQGISGVFDEIIQKACEPDPARRYATALEFAEELQMLADILQEPTVGTGQQMYVQETEQPSMQPMYAQKQEQSSKQPTCGQPLVQQPRRQFVSPVARKFSQIILRTVQMKHTRGILVKHYGLLLFMADFRIGFNDILGRISDVMQLYRNRIFIISQGDNGFVNSLRHRFRLMRDILQQK